MDEQTQQKVIKTLDSVAQNAHMLTGAFYAFFFIVIKHPAYLWFALPIYVGVTAWKEFHYDQNNEIPEIRGSNTKDFVFYQIGWIGALLIYFLLG